MPKSVTSDTSRGTEATDATDATDATEASDAVEKQSKVHPSRRKSKKRDGEVEEDRGAQKDAEEDVRLESLGPLYKQDIIQLNKILPQIERAKAEAKTNSSPTHKHGPTKSHHHHQHQPLPPKSKSKKSKISSTKKKTRGSRYSKHSLVNQPLDETALKLPVLAVLVPPQAVLKPTAHQAPPPPPIQPVVKPTPPHNEPKGHVPDVKMYIYDKYAAKYTVKQLEMVLSKSYYTGHLVAIIFWVLFLCTGVVIDYLQYDSFLLRESTYHIISSYDVGLISSARNNKFGWSILLILLLLLGCLISYFALSRSYLTVGLACISIISLQALIIVLAVTRDYRSNSKIQNADTIPVVQRINLALMIVICGCWIIWQSAHYILAIITIRRLHDRADHFYRSSGGV